MGIVSLLFSYQVAAAPTATNVHITYPLDASHAIAYNTTYIATPKPPPPPVREAPNNDGYTGHLCWCLEYARWRSGGLGYSGYGYAARHPINSTTPAEQGLVFTYESSLGHAAFYIRYGDYIILDERNYVGCVHTVGRKLLIGDPRIRGYFNATPTNNN